MPRFPTPWSKKRGKRSLSSGLGGVAGEAAFYASLFLLGVFGLSLVLITRFAPLRAPDVSAEALSGGLSYWVFGVISLAAIGSGGGGMIFRLMRLGASSERRSALASRAGSIEMISPASDEQKLPTVPQGKSLTESPGERLTYRLAVENTDDGGITGPAT